MSTMTHRHLIITGFIAALCIGAVVSSGVLTALLLFILMGSIPGTDLVLSPDMMLGILIGIFSFFIIQMLIRSISQLQKRKLLHMLSKRRAQFPHRRYARKVAHS